MAKGKNFKLVAIAVFFVLCTAPLYLDKLLTISLNILAPRSKQFNNQKLQMLHEFPDGVLGFSWSDDASHLILNINNWPKPDMQADFNLKTGKVVLQEGRTSSNQISLPEIIRQLGIDVEAESWALCTEKNRIIAAGGFEGEQYWLKYWENKELINTFYFSSNQWPADYRTPYASIEFSPSCGKATLILDGLIYDEAYGNQELWMLDSSSLTFQRLIIGKSPVFSLIEYPTQDVMPGWSPDEDRFVFGGWTFGLEVYDLSSAKRRILAGPDYNLHGAQWSPSGKWIAAIQSEDKIDKLYILSSDGSLHSMTEACDRISDFPWAPEEDKIAFMCHNADSDSLWLWDLE